MGQVSFFRCGLRGLDSSPRNLARLAMTYTDKTSFLQLALSWIRISFLLFVSLPSRGSESAEEFMPAKSVSDLRERIARILTTEEVPGAGIAIVQRDGGLWTTGVGLADVGSGKVVTQDTLFRIGSISKTFTALAALKLVEEGRLKLETPVADLVPEVQFFNPWESTRPVRVVHLLEHTTGWGDWHLKEFASSDPKPLTLAEGLAFCPKSRTSRWPPGTRMSYCNSGPPVVAAIIEKITGKRFEDYVAENFFQPIGMPTAMYLLSPQTDGLLARQYHDDGRTPYPYWHIIMRPAGSVNASAREMGQYLTFFIHRGEGAAGRILSEKSLIRMETPATYWGAQGGLKTGYGLCNYTTLDDRGFVWHGHNGGVDGGLSEIGYLNDLGVGYFYSINTGNDVAAAKIGTELKAFVTRDLPKPTLPTTVPISIVITQNFRGWYQSDSARDRGTALIEPLLLLFRVSFENDKLFLKFPVWTQTYLCTGDRRFREEKMGAADLVLLETDEGRIIQTGSGTLRKISTVRAWGGITLTLLSLIAVLSVPPFACVWGIRWMLGKLDGVKHLHVRVLPLLAVLSAFAFAGILVFAGGDLIPRLGHPSVWSVSLCVSTWTFAAFSTLGLVAAVRVRPSELNRWVWMHSLVVSALFCVATVFLAVHGMIGLRTWI
jgi:CubicO group peptidase (beta-lactamase class C family)